MQSAGYLAFCAEHFHTVEADIKLPEEHRFELCSMSRFDVLMTLRAISKGEREIYDQDGKQTVV
jgi:hypothetical protein